MSRGRRSAAVLALIAALVPGLAEGEAQAKKQKKATAPALERPYDPVVFSGAQLPRLIGASPQRVIAYRWLHRKKKKARRWLRVPVQVDERAVVDFGRDPQNGSVPLSGDRTVYGTPPIGTAGSSVLQYSDPGTFVGADPDVGLDADDEVVFMAADAGDRAPAKRSRPKLAAKGGMRIALTDPLGGRSTSIYLFVAKRDPGPSPSDYVEYAFRLGSGDYRSTYDRRSGPNPESSTVSTTTYSLGFSDRWFFDQLRIVAGDSTGIGILDGYKFAFPGGGCGRSEATFNAGEGAFVVNKDGPVRAIRSYVGANSGPYTQRTHFFYTQRHEIVTDLRVHAVPGLFTHYDLSAGGVGMIHSRAGSAAAVPVDGVPDALPASPPVGWHLWRGPQGSLFVADRVVSSFQESLLASASDFYEDNSTAPSFAQCWGDSDLYGAAGFRSTAAIPDTQPGSANSLRGTSVNLYAAPGIDVARAELWSRRLDAPLGARSIPFKG